MGGNTPKKVFESDSEEHFMERNKLIVRELLNTDADIICLQEFWTANAALREIYISYLCKNHGYSMKELRRTFEWKQREDGLAIYFLL